MMHLSAFVLLVALLQMNECQNCSKSLTTLKKVEICPKNQQEIKRASESLGCEKIDQNCTEPSKFKYHCVINSRVDAIIEVCAPEWYISGYCAEFNIGEQRIKDHYKYDCTKFSMPCPTRYISTDSYKYESCYSYVKANGNSLPKNDSGMDFKSFGVLAFVIVLLLCVALIVYIIYKRKKRSRGSNMPTNAAIEEEEAMVPQSIIKNNGENAELDATSTVDKYIIVAIDIGMTYSGYAYAECTTNDDLVEPLFPRWDDGDGKFWKKTPSVLLTPSKQADREQETYFGYDAEQKYAEIPAEQETKWMYFRRFKMQLFKDGKYNQDIMIHSYNNESKLPAKSVFGMAIRSIKTKFQEEISSYKTYKKVVYVISHPAIWTMEHRAIMEEAAFEAGIDNTSLLLVTEPEAVLKYYQISQRKEDSNCIILDIGGGTTDITCDSLDHGRRDMRAGAVCGGTMVDEEFIKCLESIFSEPILDEFKRKHPEDFLLIMQRFEGKKRKIKINMTESISIKLEKNLFELYVIEHGSKPMLIDRFKNCSFSNSSFQISPDVLESLFKQTVENIAMEVRNVLNGYKSIIISGGFSESPVVRYHLNKEFQGLKPTYLFEPDLAVLRGSVIIGFENKENIHIQRSASRINVTKHTERDSFDHSTISNTSSCSIVDPPPVYSIAYADGMVVRVFHGNFDIGNLLQSIRAYKSL